MDWADIRYFLAIAREGQMLAASRKLAVSQSLLSRHLASLEASLGAQLVQRTTRGCLLTDDGERFLASAERVETEMLAAQSMFKSGSDAMSGTIRLGSPDGLGSAFIARHISTLLAGQPDLKVQLVPAPVNFSLSQREADLAIIVGRPEKGRLMTRKLTDYTLGLYASADYADRRGLPQSKSDLPQHSLVGYVGDLIPTASLNYAAEISAEWSSTIEISTAIGQQAAIKGGAGIGILHDFMAADDRDLISVLADVRITRDYWVVWHENMQSVRRVHFLVERLAQLVRDNATRFVKQTG